MSEEILIPIKKRGRKPTGKRGMSVGMSVSKELYKKAERAAQSFTRKDAFGRVYRVQDILRKALNTYLETFDFEGIENDTAVVDEGQMSFIGI